MDYTKIESFAKDINLFLLREKKDCSDVFKKLKIDEKHCNIITEIRDGFKIKNINYTILFQDNIEYKILFIILGDMIKDIQDLKATNNYERFALNICLKKKKDVKILYELLSAEVLEKIKFIGLLLSCFVISKKIQKEEEKGEKKEKKKDEEDEEEEDDENEEDDEDDEEEEDEEEEDEEEKKNNLLEMVRYIGNITNIMRSNINKMKEKTYGGSQCITLCFAKDHLVNNISNHYVDNLLKHVHFIPKNNIKQYKNKYKKIIRKEIDNASLKPCYPHMMGGGSSILPKIIFNEKNISIMMLIGLRLLKNIDKKIYNRGNKKKKMKGGNCNAFCGDVSLSQYPACQRPIWCADCI